VEQVSPSPVQPGWMMVSVLSWTRHATHLLNFWLERAVERSRLHVLRHQPLLAQGVQGETLLSWPQVGVERFAILCHRAKSSVRPCHGRRLCGAGCRPPHGSPPDSLQPGASRRSTASLCNPTVITSPPGHGVTHSQWDMLANHFTTGQGPAGSLVQVPLPPPRSLQVKLHKDQVEAHGKESPVFGPA